jgi:predicted dehydrogenase
MKTTVKSIYNLLPPASVNRPANCSSQTNRKLRFGIVGAGAVAQSYMQAFEGYQEAAVVGVADISSEAAAAMAERLRCQSFTSPDQMARNCPLDAVVVCTPPVTHPDICICFLKNKVHVLCEKPLSLGLQRAQVMMETARKAGVRLMMASKFRYVDDIVQARSIVASGMLGDLVLCKNVFATRMEMASRWNSVPEISGGGVVIDNGTHSVDLMRYFLGPLAKVQVLEGKRSPGSRVEETVVMLVRNASGVIGTIDLSWAITKQRDSYLDIYGTRGALAVGWKQSQRLDYVRGEWVVFGNGYNKLLAFRKQIENFTRVVRGEEGPLITDEDALASVNVVEAAYNALRTGQWVPVTSSWSALRLERTEGSRRPRDAGNAVDDDAYRSRPGCT